MSEKITVSKEVAEALDYVITNISVNSLIHFFEADAGLHSRHAKVLRENMSKETILQAIFEGYDVEDPVDHLASFVDDCARLAANSPLEGTRRFYQGAHAGALTAARILGVKLPEGDRAGE